MARVEVLAGLSLGTERPYLDKRFADLTSLSNDFGGENQLVGIAYDPRHRNPSTNNALIWLAGDSNQKLYVCDSKTMLPVISFTYPQASSLSPATKCFGLAIIPTPTDMDIMFLTEAGLDSTGCPILYQLRYVPTLPADEQLQITMWYYLATTTSSTTFVLESANRGMTEYKGDLMVIGKYKGNTTFAWLSRNGQILAHYPDVTTADSPKGLLHMHDRVFSCMDATSDPDVGGRYLGKFLTDNIDKKPGTFVKLMSIEPFFLSGFNGDLSLFQDNMAACDKDIVYTYKMLYFCFVFDNMFTDDIDMGSVLIGDYKIKRGKLKNIADKYSLKDVQITTGTVICPGAVSNCPAKEALAWVKMSTVDPETTNDDTIWSDTIYFATTRPWIYPDGEREFWIKVDVPTTYAALTVENTSTPRPVEVDDGPFVVPLNISAKVG